MDMEEIRDFTDPEFQEVFRTYFTEIGVNLKPDTDIWDEIAASGFVVVDVLNAANRSALVLDEMARRYGFDVRLRYRRTDSRSISTVEKVNPVGGTKKE